MNRWYVVYTQPRSEDRARWHLINQGFHCFLPKIRRVRSHARRRDTVLEPLFPRYLFTYFDCGVARWRSINGSYGVTHILTHGSDPVPVLEGLIERLTQEADSEGVMLLTALNAILPGTEVRVTGGTLAGQTAKVAELVATGNDRTRILLKLLGKAMQIELPTSELAPA